MILVRIYEIRAFRPGTHRKLLVLPERFQCLQYLLLRRRKGKVGDKYRSSSRPCSVRVARDGVSISVSIPDTLFIFVYLRNTAISLPRTRRGFSAYACKVRLTPWPSAKTSARLTSGLYEYARDLAKTLEDGADVGFDGIWW